MQILQRIAIVLGIVVLACGIGVKKIRAEPMELVVTLEPTMFTSGTSAFGFSTLPSPFTISFFFNDIDNSIPGDPDVGRYEAGNYSFNFSIGEVIYNSTETDEAHLSYNLFHQIVGLNSIHLKSGSELKATFNLITDPQVFTANDCRFVPTNCPGMIGNYTNVLLRPAAPPPPPPPPTGNMPFTLDFEDNALPSSHDWHLMLQDNGNHEIVDGNTGAGGTKVLRMNGEDRFGWFLNLEGVVDLNTDWVFSADTRRIAGGGAHTDQGIERFGSGNGGSGFAIRLNDGDWNNILLVMDHANNEVRTYVNGSHAETNAPIDDLSPFVNSSNAVWFGFGNEGVSATAEFDNIIFVIRGIDSDNDGLEDVDELVLGTDINDNDSDDDGLNDGAEVNLGTNPSNADSDDDGLLDGTEVDMAAGSGCPNPLDSDSDDDTLLDGGEVTNGTNPCTTDTDGDGLPDNTDPTPTEPGAPPGFLQQEALNRADDIRSLDLSRFNGPNDNANEGRRNALANRAMDAAAAIGEGDIQSAIDSLDSLLDKVDGETPPPDWMEDSPEKTALAADIRQLISLLENSQ